MTLDRIRAERVIAVLRRVPEPETIVDALVAAGIRIVEITLDSDGVDASNARDFLAAGAVAVGVGSSLTGADDVDAKARRLVAAISR